MYTDKKNGFIEEETTKQKKTRTHDECLSVECVL